MFFFIYVFYFVLQRGSARIRISSAVTADDRRQAPKERIAPFVFDTRPNTTHSFTVRQIFEIVTQNLTGLNPISS